MQDWVISVMDRFGYFGVALLIAIENIFPPIPSEVILAFGGFMTTYTSMNIGLVVLFATAGSVFGAIVLYSVGHLMTPHRFSVLIEKWGPVLRVKKEDIKKAESWFIQRGNATIFFCRFIPIIRSLISIPAGMANMNLGWFLLYTALGTALWNLVLVNLGALAGENWSLISIYLETYSTVVWILLGVAATLLLIRYLMKRKARQPHQN